MLSKINGNKTQKSSRNVLPYTLKCPKRFSTTTNSYKIHTHDIYNCTQCHVVEMSVRFAADNHVHRKPVRATPNANM